MKFSLEQQENRMFCQKIYEREKGGVEEGRWKCFGKFDLIDARQIGRDTRAKVWRIDVTYFTNDHVLGET